MRPFSAVAASVLKLRIGSGPGMGAAQAFYAQETGIYKGHDLDVEPRRYDAYSRRRSEQGGHLAEEKTDRAVDAVTFDSEIARNFFEESRDG